MPNTQHAVIVPHLDRTPFLKSLLPNLLSQSTPATVVICDQGQTAETAELLSSDEFAGNPRLVHLPSPATCLWENWKFGAGWAIDQGFDSFSWCQDDDVVHHRYVERIIQAFDHFPTATAWTARLACGENAVNAIWYSSNGPLVPMDLMHNRQIECQGELLAPVAYLTSWALSPAVAFRITPDIRDILSEQPSGCDLFTERTILASAGRRGWVVCDPATVGLWIHHGKNECYSQRKDQKVQREIFIAWMDDLMDGIADWQTVFDAWSRMMPVNFLMGFLGTLDESSRYASAIEQIIKRNLSTSNPPALSNQTIAGNAGEVGGPAAGLGGEDGANGVRKAPALVI